MSTEISSEQFRQQLALAASEGAMWGGLLDIADDYARAYAAEQLRASDPTPAHGPTDALDRVRALMPKPGEFVGSCCEHCAAIEDFLVGLR